MKFLIVIFCVIFYTYGQTNNNCSCGWTNKDAARISRGDRAGEYEFPMMAGLVPFESSTIFCGGVIITNRHVITAARCTSGFKPKMFGIHAGKNIYKKKILDGILNLTGNNGRGLYDIESFTEHPNYNPVTSVYDISIITIEDKFKFKDNLGPACMPMRPLDLKGETLQIMGWGSLISNGPQSKYLLKGTVSVKNDEECIRTYKNFEKYDRHQICTYSDEHSACQGDIGGPLLYVEPQTRKHILVGVMSYGIDCGKFRFVNTDVTRLLVWIKKVISKTAPSASPCS